MRCAHSRFTSCLLFSFDYADHLLFSQGQVVRRLPDDWRFSWPVWRTLDEPVEKGWRWNGAISTTHAACKNLNLYFTLFILFLNKQYLLFNMLV